MLRWIGERFPQAVVNHLQVSYSDHDLIFLIIHGSAINTRKKKIPKRFEEKWATHLECKAIIQEVWSKEPPVGSPMFQLFSKIRDCRMALVAWSRNMGSTRTRIEEKKQLQTLTAQNDPANLELIQKVRDDINSLLYQEEIAFRQRSRSIWLPTGDKNTKFFHQRASQCHCKNNIGFMDEGGRWCTSDAEKEGVVERYFQRLFTTTKPTQMDMVLHKVDRVVTRDMNHTLLQPYLQGKVQQALFQMHPSKSSGSDGMSPSSSFFKSIGILLVMMSLKQCCQFYHRVTCCTR